MESGAEVRWRGGQGRNRQEGMGNRHFFRWRSHSSGRTRRGEHYTVTIFLYHIITEELNRKRLAAAVSSVPSSRIHPVRPMGSHALHLGLARPAGRPVTHLKQEEAPALLSNPEQQPCSHRGPSIVSILWTTGRSVATATGRGNRRLCSACWFERTTS